MDRINPLTEAQLRLLPQDKGDRIVRFMVVTNPLKPKTSLESVNICTGITEGGNVINQYVYWSRPTGFVDLVLGFLRENNPDRTFKVIDSE